MYNVSCEVCVYALQIHIYVYKIQCKKLFIWEVYIIYTCAYIYIYTCGDILYKAKNNNKEMNLHLVRFSNPSAIKSHLKHSNISKAYC